mgnify:FL=1
MRPKKFLLKKNPALELVVGEEPVEFGPNGEGVIPVADHRVEEILGDGEVEPPDECSIDGRPLYITEHEAGIHGTVDVIMEMILAEH